ncbi:hypothetical protein SISSUDRAFT_1050030 [Sistotremastrum suecicum HHB10207 ss-3]|uniref:Uncharacterized protein n=1 Tax=Sistotremastrum suecicum HHB10207 ss-3 TaxID=1314776 RepID=A0A166BG69_9AGAM|nr:hypothetical protein SISSUDRAFT_1050030 [Sistotremastrum suecicum HHB10207 ss-3]
MASKKLHLTCTNYIQRDDVNKVRSQTCAALVGGRTKAFKEHSVQPPNVLEENLATFYSSRLYKASVSCHRTPLKDAA